MKKIVFACIIAVLASCNTQKKISYFQDTEPGVAFDYTKGENITLKNGDMISITVSSKNPELAMIFNLVRIQQVLGSENNNAISNSAARAEMSGYIIDSKGEIDFPVLGKLPIAGKTKEQTANYVKARLITEKLIMDPVVTVQFVNLQFSVMGDVLRPGLYSIAKDKTTILEALSMAGDLNITGQRNKVFLTRNVGEQKITYQLNLRSKDIYQSPAFYVEQNDVIYVEPNRMKANLSTVSGNSIFSTSFWISLASLGSTIATLFLVYKPNN